MCDLTPTRDVFMRFLWLAAQINTLPLKCPSSWETLESDKAHVQTTNGRRVIMFIQSFRRYRDGERLDRTTETVCISHLFKYD
jgi:hypothetical protein